VRTGGGRPRILDVVAEGVSWILTYRSGFGSIIGREGLDGLQRQMRGRASSAGPAS